MTCLGAGFLVGLLSAIILHTVGGPGSGLGI